MGRAKALWMEMQESDWEYSEHDFECPACEASAFFGIELPTVYEESEDLEFPTTGSCSACQRIFEVHLHTNWDHCTILFDDYDNSELILEPERGFVHEPDWDYEDYQALEEDGVFRPAKVFKKSILGIRLLLQESTPKLVDQDANSLLNRMLLTQAITSLEAYLSDMLLILVETRPAAQRRILSSKEVGIGSRQFKLSEAHEVEHFAKRELLRFVRESTLHNLPKAKLLYQLALKVDITPDQKELEVLNSAVLIRHDCVHRNGGNKETGEIHEIADEYILSVVDAVSRVVSRIENEVWPF